MEPTFLNVGRAAVDALSERAMRLVPVSSFQLGFIPTK